MCQRKHVRSNYIFVPSAETRVARKNWQKCLKIYQKMWCRRIRARHLWATKTLSHVTHRYYTSNYPFCTKNCQRLRLMVSGTGRKILLLNWILSFRRTSATDNKNPTADIAKMFKQFKELVKTLPQKFQPDKLVVRESPPIEQTPSNERIDELNWPTRELSEQQDDRSFPLQVISFSEVIKILEDYNHMSYYKLG